MSVRLFRGEAAVAAIDPAHRGIAYGDGLFETMRVHGGRVHWWARHWQRLRQGASRLGLVLPQQGFVRQQCDALVADAPATLRDGCVLKLIASRSPGGRGYLPQSDQCDWQLSLHPLPPAAPPGGLRLRWCTLRLAAQPALAGLKHCNRLEQVLARAEWSDPAIDEGLLLDAQGQVVSATAANLFVLRDGQWQTPTLETCGVAGICRGWALQALGAVEASLWPDDIESAEALFLANAVRGILPVASLGRQQWSPHPAVATARRQLASDHPAFAPTF